MPPADTQVVPGQRNGSGGKSNGHMAQQLEFRREAPNWPNSAFSRFVDAGGLRWHVQIMGSGPVILLIHGTGASTHSWRGLISELSKNHTIIAPDMPGHGFTVRPPDDHLTLPGMAHALGALLAALQMKPEIAVGHSAGAAILLRAALDNLIKPRMIVSLNGALLPFRGFAGQIFKPLAKFLVMQPFLPQFFAWRAGSRGAVERLLRGTGSVPSAEDVDLYGRLFQSPDHVGATLAMMANWDLNPLVRDLPNLKIPVVLVTGERDLAVPASDAVEIAKHIPRAEIVNLPGLGHLAHEEAPALVARLIEQREAVLDIK